MEHICGDTVPLKEGLRIDRQKVLFIHFIPQGRYFRVEEVLLVI